MNQTRIRELRTQHKLTQEQLAALVGDNKHNLSNVENGRRKLGAGLAYKLERALGLEPYSLIGEVVELPATLSDRKDAIPGLLTCLRLPRPLVSSRRPAGALALQSVA